MNVKCMNIIQPVDSFCLGDAVYVSAPSSALTATRRLDLFKIDTYEQWRS